MSLKVEFVGLSGAGKTTMSKALAKQYDIPDVARTTSSFSWASRRGLMSVIRAIILLVRLHITFRMTPSKWFIYAVKAFALQYHTYNYNKQYTTGHGFIQTFLQFTELFEALLTKKKRQ